MRNLAIVEDHPVSQHEMSSEVLILDDSEFDRKRLRRTLSKLPIGLNFTEGADLFTFRQQVQHKSYDLILCGIMSEDMMQFQVGPMLARRLSLPCATAVIHETIKPDEKKISVDR